MDFVISGLSAKPFQHLYGLSTQELSEQNIIRYSVDAHPGFSDRIEMRDAAVGETMLLINYQHQPAQTPYQASHAIFIREGALKAYQEINIIPQVLSIRPQSLRGFDQDGMLLDADIASGERELTRTIQRLFKNKQIAYIHSHNAKQGCYSGLIKRA